MRERVFRALLRLLPRDFRARFEAEMLDTERSAAAHRSDKVAASAAAFLDLLVTAFVVRVDTFRASPLRSESGPMLSSWIQDARFALRGLRRDPVFTGFAVATLGLGIGACGTMFGIVDRLLLRGPDHVADVDRMVRVYVSHQPAGMRRFTSAGVGHVTFDLVRNRVDAFAGVASYMGAEVTVGRGAQARRALVNYASGTFFEVLGVEPVLGRFFGPADDNLAGASAVAVLSHGAWVRDFGGDPNAIGREIVVGDQSHTVVGVAPPGFTGAELEPVELWMPINLRSPSVTQDWATSWNAQWMQVIGRLAPGASTESAAEQLTAAFRAGYGGDEESMRTADLFVAPLHAGDTGSEVSEARVARWLLGVSALLLLAVCANLVNLLLARGIRRTRELSVRLALGASAARVRRLLLAESFLLAAGGAVCALAVAWALGGVARRTLLAFVHWSTPPVDARVLAATLAIALLVGALMGVTPALRSVRLARTSSLAGASARDGGRRTLLRKTLSVTQAALSTALLIGAGLFLRSLANAQSTELGVEAERALVVELRYPPLANLAPEQVGAERARRRAFPLEAIEPLSRIPGVTHVAVAIGMPFGNRFTVSLRVPDLDSVPRLSTGAPSISAVSPHYFAAVGTQVLRGRAFQAGEGASSDRVAIVSETMARTVWPGQEAIGQCLIAMIDTLPCARVVGVAADTHRGSLREEPSMHYYIPAGQELGFGGAVLLLRASDDPLALGEGVRRTLTALDPSISNVELGTLQQRIDPQLRPWRLGSSVLASAGLLGLITMVVGIYSITSYLVSLRRREIGVRLALGARRGQVARLVMGEAAATALVGSLLGTGVALAAGGFLGPLLFDVSPADPVVIGAAVSALLLSSLLACVLPCVRANQIAPVESLQAE